MSLDALGAALAACGLTPLGRADAEEVRACFGTRAGEIDAADFLAFGELAAGTVGTAAGAAARVRGAVLAAVEAGVYTDAADAFVRRARDRDAAGVTASEFQLACLDTLAILTPSDEKALLDRCASFLFQITTFCCAACYRSVLWHSLCVPFGVLRIK